MALSTQDIISQMSVELGGPPAAQPPSVTPLPFAFDTNFDSDLEAIGRPTNAQINEETSSFLDSFKEFALDSIPVFSRARQVQQVGDREDASVGFVPELIRSLGGAGAGFGAGAAIGSIGGIPGAAIGGVLGLAFSAFAQTSTDFSIRSMQEAAARGEEQTYMQGLQNALSDPLQASVIGADVALTALSGGVGIAAKRGTVSALKTLGKGLADGTVTRQALREGVESAIKREAVIELGVGLPADLVTSAAFTIEQGLHDGKTVEEAIFSRDFFKNLGITGTVSALLSGRNLRVDAKTGRRLGRALDETPAPETILGEVIEGVAAGRGIRGSSDAAIKRRAETLQAEVRADESQLAGLKMAQESDFDAINRQDRTEQLDAIGPDTASSLIRDRLSKLRDGGILRKMASFSPEQLAQSLKSPLNNRAGAQLEGPTRQKGDPEFTDPNSLSPDAFDGEADIPFVKIGDEEVDTRTPDLFPDEPGFETLGPKEFSNPRSVTEPQGEPYADFFGQPIDPEGDKKALKRIYDQSEGDPIGFDESFNFTEQFDKAEQEAVKAKEVELALEFAVDNADNELFQSLTPEQTAFLTNPQQFMREFNDGGGGANKSIDEIIGEARESLTQWYRNHKDSPFKKQDISSPELFVKAMDPAIPPSEAKVMMDLPSMMEPIRARIDTKKAQIERLGAGLHRDNSFTKAVNKATRGVVGAPGRALDYYSASVIDHLEKRDSPIANGLAQSLRRWSDVRAANMGDMSQAVIAFKKTMRSPIQGNKNKRQALARATDQQLKEANIPNSRWAVFNSLMLDVEHGDPRKMSPQRASAVNLYRNVIKSAEGVLRKNGVRRGGNLFVGEAEGKRFQRLFTHDHLNILSLGEGHPDFEHYVRTMLEVNPDMRRVDFVKEADLAKRVLVDGDLSAIKQVGLFEDFRQIKNMPSELIFPGGRKIHLLEVDPIDHIEGLSRTVSSRAAVSKVFGQTTPTGTPVEGAGDEVPLNRLIDRFLDNDEDTDLLRESIALMHNRPGYELFHSVDERLRKNKHNPGFWRDLAGAGHAVFRGTALSASAIVNLAQISVLGPAFAGPIFGRGLPRFAKSLVKSANVKASSRELKNLGAIVDAMIRFDFDANRPISSAAEQVSHAITLPFRMINNLNDIMAGNIGRVLADDLRQGKSNAGDFAALRNAGFSVIQARQMMKGNAPAELYDSIPRRVIGASQFTHLSPVEGTRSFNSPTMQLLFDFQSYSQGTIRAISRHVDTIEKARPGSEKAAALGAMGRALMGGQAAGFATVALGAFMFGRELSRDDETNTEWLWRNWSETLVAAPLRTLAYIRPDEDPSRLLQMSPKWSAFTQLTKALNSQERFADKTPSETMVEFLYARTPLLRTRPVASAGAFMFEDIDHLQRAHFVAAGLRDPKIDKARSNYFKWVDDNFPEELKGIKVREGYDGFRRSLDKAVEAIRNGQTKNAFRHLVDAELVAELEIAQNPKDRRSGRMAISQRIKSKMFFPRLERDEPRLLKFLREVHPEDQAALRRHDALMETLVAAI